MKALLTLSLLAAIATTTFGQLANDNTFGVQIDGKDYKAQPRRTQLGNYWWVTANTIKPDQSIRIWLGSLDHKDVVEPGAYLIVDADNPDTKDNRAKAQDSGTYKRIAIVKYVEEIKEPRMEYHVGKSQNNGETISVKTGADGLLEATFSSTLAGTFCKARASATVFGGMDRPVGKMQEKAITKTTGYNSDIDPEGNGYKVQGQTDKIVLTNGQFRLKMN